MARVTMTASSFLITTYTVIKSSSQVIMSILREMPVIFLNKGIAKRY